MRMRGWVWQTMHIARKDLRMSWMFIIAYSAVVAYTTVLIATESDFSPLVQLGILILSPLYAAWLIQEESPYRADAYWAGKPLYPTSIIAGKICLAALVTSGIALAGHATALILAYGAVPPNLLSELGVTAGILAAVICGTAVRASVTPDLRTLLLVVIVEFVLMQVIAMFSFNRGYEIESLGTLGITFRAVVLLVAGLAILAYVYQSRNRKHGIVLAILLAIAPWAIPNRLPANILTKAAGLHHDLADEVRRPLIHAWIDPRYAQAGSAVTLQFSVDSIIPSYHYTLSAQTAELHYLDGRRTEVRTGAEPISLNRPTPPPTGSIAWHSDQVSGQHRAGHGVHLTAREWAALEAGTANLLVRGQVEVQASAVTARLPFSAGADERSNGQRTEILKVSPSNPDTIITIRSLQLEPELGGIYWGNPPEFAVVNTRRSEGVVLFPRSGLQVALGILPPVSGSKRRIINLALRGGSHEQPSVAPDWFRGAELVRVSWRRLGSYPVSIPVTVAIDEPPRVR